MLDGLDAETTFQSTRPVKGATALDGYLNDSTVFQSTRPVKGATRTGGEHGHTDAVSIHAPREGRDVPGHS